MSGGAVAPEWREAPSWGRNAPAVTLLLAALVLGVVSASTVDARLAYLGVALLALAAVWCSHRGRLTAAGLLTMACCAVVPIYGLATPGATTSAVSEILWMTLAPLVGATLLPPRWYAAAVGLHVTVISTLLLSNPQIPRAAATEAALVLLFASTIGYLHATRLRGYELRLDAEKADLTVHLHALEALREAAETLVQGSDIQRAVGGVCAGVRSTLDLALVTVYRVDQRREELRLYAADGYEIPTGHRLPLAGTSLLCATARAARRRYVADVGEAAEYLAGSGEVRSEYLVPLTVDDKVAGVANFESRRIDGFPPEVREHLDAVGRLVSLALERADLDEELALSENRYRLASSAGRVGVWEWDRRDGFFYVDPVVKGFLGYRPEEIGNTVEQWRRFVRPEYLPEVERALQAYLSHRAESFEVAYAARHRDGAPRWILARGAASRRDADGEIVRMVGTHTDITAIRQAQLEVLTAREQLARANEELELRVVERTRELHDEVAERSRAEEGLRKAYRELHDTQRQLLRAGKLAAVGDMSTGIADELNHPISSIDRCVARLTRSPAHLVGERLDELETIAEQTRRMGKIVQSLRDFARPGEMIFSRLLLVDPLERALESLDPELRCAAVEVERRFDGRLPPMSGDPVLLQQLFGYLLSNAVQALETLAAASERSVAVEVRGGEDSVTAVVEDSGPGVADALIGRIFDPFFTTRPPGSGVGLGLSLASSIVQSHGGELTYEHRPGGGARFVVRLPLSGGQGMVGRGRGAVAGGTSGTHRGRFPPARLDGPVS